MNYRQVDRAISVCLVPYDRFADLTLTVQLVMVTVNEDDRISIPRKAQMPW